MSSPSGEVLVANVVRFARLLRRAGLPVEPGQTRLFLQAVILVGLDQPRSVRAAGRAIFARRREDGALFDRAFALFWHRPGGPPDDAPLLPRISQSAGPEPTFPAPAPAHRHAVERNDRRFATLPSARERLARADFAALTPTEAGEALALLAALRPAVPVRRSRRWRNDRRGVRPELRRTFRGAPRTEGELLVVLRRLHPVRPRPLVLIADISGSMQAYSRLALRFAHVLSRSGAPLEVFVFGTRLTRITRPLRVRDADEALRRVAAAVVDWNGGTRIGESLRELNRHWVRRTIRSGAVVLLLSDGWERGDPQALGREMATLRRSCHRVLWLNPLAGRPGFAPEVAGLRAALPQVDKLLPCATVRDLQRVARELQR